MPRSCALPLSLLLILAVPSSASAQTATPPNRSPAVLPNSADVAHDLLTAEINKLLELVEKKYDILNTPAKIADRAEKVLKAEEFAEAVKQAKLGERPSTPKGIVANRLVEPLAKLAAAIAARKKADADTINVFSATETDDPAKLQSIKAESRKVLDRLEATERQLAILAERVDQAGKFIKLVRDYQAALLSWMESPSTSIPTFVLTNLKSDGLFNYVLAWEWFNVEALAGELANYRSAVRDYHHELRLERCKLQISAQMFSTTVEVSENRIANKTALQKLQDRRREAEAVIAEKGPAVERANRNLTSWQAAIQTQQTFKQTCETASATPFKCSAGFGWNQCTDHQGEKDTYVQRKNAAIDNARRAAAKIDELTARIREVEADIAPAAREYNAAVAKRDHASAELTRLPRQFEEDRRARLAAADKLRSAIELRERGLLEARRLERTRELLDESTLNRGAFGYQLKAMMAPQRTTDAPAAPTSDPFAKPGTPIPADPLAKSANSPPADPFAKPAVTPPSDPFRR